MGTTRPNVTFAYNTAVSERKGFSPLRLVYGGEATTKLDALLLNRPGDDEDIAMTALPQFRNEPKKPVNWRDSGRKKEQGHVDASR